MSQMFPTGFESGPIPFEPIPGLHTSTHSLTAGSPNSSPQVKLYNKSYHILVKRNKICTNRISGH